MGDIPVKRYLMRRARKWLKRKLVPVPLRARAVTAKWARPDLEAFPPRHQSEVKGLERFEYSWLSQNGEDGILRYVFDQIGVKSGWLVEFGFGAKQCNALRLIVKEGFFGLLMDGARENVDFFNSAATNFKLDDRAIAVQSFITRANLEELIVTNKVPNDIDFLSIDVDGNDYWLWETLNCVSPRVVCIEYNAGLGPELSVTVPYDDAFERFTKHPSGFFYGASLVALVKLGEQKGYYLIGCDSTGTNAFFLREDIAVDGLPRLHASEAFRPHANWLGRGISEAEQLKIMSAMPYQKI